MSRTFRNGSALWKYKRVRDGRRTRADKSCENGGDCPWCFKNRRYNYLKYGDYKRTDLEEQRDELGEKD